MVTHGIPLFGSIDLRSFYGPSTESIFQWGNLLRKWDSPKNCGYRWDLGGVFGSNVTLVVLFNPLKLQEFPNRGKSLPAQNEKVARTQVHLS